MISKETCLIFEFNELPDSFRNKIKEMESFHNDCYIEHWSECAPNNWTEKISWEESLRSSIEEGYEIDKFDQWMLDEKIDLKGITLILFRICW